MMYCLNDNSLLWLPPVIFEQMSPKMPRKEVPLLYVCHSIGTVEFKTSLKKGTSILVLCHIHLKRHKLI